jgi:hypothetical protein
MRGDGCAFAAFGYFCVFLVLTHITVVAEPRMGEDLNVESDTSGAVILSSGLMRNILFTRSAIYFEK